MRFLLLSMALLVAMTSNCKADLIYEFRFSPTTTSVLPGTQTIDVFLDQTATDLDVANLHTLGLGLANFTVNSSDAGMVFSGISGFVNDGIDIGATVDVSTAGSAIFSQSSLLNPGTIASGTLATSGSSTFSTIKIGTVSFSLAAGQSVTLTTASFTNGDFDLADPFFPTPIASITGANLTITAVPEPSSLALIAITAFACGCVRRRSAR